MDVGRLGWEYGEPGEGEEEHGETYLMKGRGKGGSQAAKALEFERVTYAGHEITLRVDAPNGPDLQLQRPQ